MTTLTESFPGFSVPFVGSEELERVVESLWQRGYDVKRDGYGWAIKEPMGAGHVTLRSDAELIEFAAAGGRRGRVVTVQPTVQPTTAHRTGTSARQPVQVQLESGAKIAASRQEVRQSSPIRFRWFEWVQWVVAQFGRQGKRSVAKAESLRHVLAGGLVFLFFLVAWLVSGVVSSPELAREEEHLPSQLNAEAPVPNANDGKAEGLAIRNLATGVRTNSRHVPSPVRAVEPMMSLPDVPDEAQRGRDLSVFAQQCASRLEERFSIGRLALLVNIQGRHADSCYLIDGVEHCPYVMQGQATLNFVDEATSPPLIYACDIDLKKTALGNLRRVEANPDIVRFLVGEPRGGA